MSPHLFLLGQACYGSTGKKCGSSVSGGFQQQKAPLLGTGFAAQPVESFWSWVLTLCTPNCWLWAGSSVRGTGKSTHVKQTLRNKNGLFNSSGQIRYCWEGRGHSAWPIKAAWFCTRGKRFFKKMFSKNACVPSHSPQPHVYSRCYSFRQQIKQICLEQVFWYVLLRAGRWILHLSVMYVGKLQKIGV